jgi:hypothetical protein
MKKVRQLLILLLCSVSFTVVAQQGGGGSGDSGGGNSTKIWEPDLVELWIFWHKQQYRMFEEFNHNEDTLNTVQHQELRNYMEDLRKVDEILFKQYQDNDQPRPIHLLPEAGIAGEMVLNLGIINANAAKLVTKQPYDEDVAIAYIQANIRTTKEMIDLIATTVKYLNGWDRKNLRDNDFRDNLSDFIIKKLESMQGDWNNLYRKWETSKYEKSFKKARKL